MKIVIFGKEEPAGTAGIGVYTERLREFLEKRGHQVWEIRFSRKAISGKNTFRIPYHLAGKRTMIFIPALNAHKKIEDYIRRLQPDIVYTPIALSPLDFYLPTICHRLGIPVAATWHGDFNNTPRLHKFIYRLPYQAFIPFCKRIDLLHVFSKEMKKYYVGKGVPAKKIVVIPNGVDEKFYRPGKSEFAKKYQVAIGVLFLGRLTIVKNPEMVIKSFLATNPPPSTKLILVGGGDLEETLRNKYQDPRIIFTGLVTNPKEKLDIIRACQVFVLPSIYEGMSLSLLEAMSCGLACVATGVGTHKKLLSGAGVVLPLPNLQKNLTESLVILLNNLNERVLLGKEARKRVRENNSQKKIFLRLEEGLQKTVTNYQ